MVALKKYNWYNKYSNKSNKKIYYGIGFIFIIILISILILVFYYSSNIISSSNTNNNTNNTNSIIDETNCTQREYFDKVELICKPCNTFKNNNSIINNSCTDCTGPLEIDCKHALCEIGNYSVYNEYMVECNKCNTQPGCNINNIGECHTINNVDNTYKCKLGQNLEGYYIDSNGISNICLPGTYSNIKEGTINGCNSCTTQEGCNSHQTICSTVDGFKDKLSCNLDGNMEDYYIDNGISKKCLTGTYNLEGSGESQCIQCTEQSNCTNSGQKCLKIDGFKEWFLNNDLIYVGGGNTFYMLELWKKNNLIKIFEEGYDKGIILSGVSAGAICWFDWMLSDSKGLGFKPLRGINLISGSCTPHSSDGDRINQFQKDIKNSKLPEGIAIDDGVAVLFIDGKPSEVYSSRKNHDAYFIDKNKKISLKEHIKKNYE